LKGDTAGTAMKKVQVETGGEINVPIFVKQGDVVKIDLRDLSYVERVNK
jgi:elongation factor P